MTNADFISSLEPRCFVKSQRCVRENAAAPCNTNRGNVTNGQAT